MHPLPPTPRQVWEIGASLPLRFAWLALGLIQYEYWTGYYMGNVRTLGDTMVRGYSSQGYLGFRPSRQASGSIEVSDFAAMLL